MRKLPFFFFLLFFIVSCTDRHKVPKGILPEEKMQAILWSMISAGEFLNAYILNKGSVDKLAESSKVYGQVFQVHHTTKEEFDRSYLYYREHPDLMKTILDSLSKRPTYSAEQTQKKEDSLQKQQDSLQKQMDTMQKKDDTLRKPLLKKPAIK